MEPVPGGCRMSRQINHVSDRDVAAGQKQVTAICGLRVPPHKIVRVDKRFPYPSCVGCTAILMEREKEATRG